jgi:hypothetical protein
MSTHSLRVAVVWGDTVYREHTFLPTSRPEVRVGEADTNDFSLPAPGLPARFRMFVRSEQGYQLRLPEDVEARVIRDGEASTWDELRSAGSTQQDLDETSADVDALALLVDDWGVVELGNVEVFFQVIEHRDRVAGRGLRGSLDGSVVLAVMAAALMMGAILTAAFLSYDPSLEYERPAHADQWARVLVDEVDEPIEDEEPDDEVQRSSKAAGGDEGTFGEPDRENETELAEVEGPEVEEVDPSNVGVTKALSSELLGSGPLKSMFGNQDGFDAKMNAAIAGEPGDLVVGRGTRGMSLRGTGSGGPGDGDSFGQVGGLGQVNSGGRDPADAHLVEKQETEVEPTLETGTPVGGEFCDPGSVSRVVQKKANAIKYCYERQLQQHPDMSGKVVAQWKIMLDGSVSGATTANSTLQSSSGGAGAVERCVNRVVERMRFEAPDGGICVINYPFVFSGIR